MDVRPKGASGEERQSETARTYEIPWPRSRGLVEDGRPCERAHGPRLDRRKGLEMSKRRKNQFREALDAKREALASAAKQRKQEPEPEWEPVIHDTSNAVPKPAGWDDPTPGNPYTDSYRAMERERVEREVRENRKRDRAEVEHLNSPEVRGITGV
jgi:hypothetical protein